MNTINTIWEDFELPSKGMIYDKPINPRISLRSMTVAEEMKRLSPTETPYKVMSDIIEDCMKDKPAIHVSDMCIGDYQYLLHKIRIVTYGPYYKMSVTCPECHSTQEITINLDDLEVKRWSEDLINEQLIKLPVSNKTIELKFQTPHDLDLVAYRAKEMKSKLKSSIDFSLLFTIISLIKTIDGRVPTGEELQEFVKTLPTKDANYILDRANKLTDKVGIDTTVKMTCAQCGHKFEGPFRITTEFFGPSND